MSLCSRHTMLVLQRVETQNVSLANRSQHFILYEHGASNLGGSIPPLSTCVSSYTTGLLAGASPLQLWHQIVDIAGKRLNTSRSKNMVLRMLVIQCPPQTVASLATSRASSLVPRQCDCSIKDADGN
mmetsp:Transcript_82276/g.158945  ORF Transcript_82276/g.158945 Transcript_82276/m.158945 type:complete len:127 (+) Transcript_82276:91-471(+)